jgi:hypothetical protein
MGGSEGKGFGISDFGFGIWDLGFNNDTGAGER